MVLHDRNLGPKGIAIVDSKAYDSADPGKGCDAKEVLNDYALAFVRN